MLSSHWVKEAHLCVNCYVASPKTNYLQCLMSFNLSLKMSTNATAAPQDALNPQHEEDERKTRAQLIILCMDVNFDSCKDPLISNIYMPRLHTHVLFYNVV